jgi:hypothetical protein
MFSDLREGLLIFLARFSPFCRQAILLVGDASRGLARDRCRSLHGGQDANLLIHTVLGYGRPAWGIVTHPRVL